MDHGMKYRSRTGLIAVILSSARGEKGGEGAPLTHIMYKSFLSYGQVKDLLKFLVEHGLLGSHKENDIKLYKMTKKGFQYLELYQRMEELVKIDSINEPVTIDIHYLLRWAGMWVIHLTHQESLCPECDARVLVYD